ncbi:uncharacterized protein LOC119705761 [Motacilla alba alba]|uniref:uncharacterized protein LOC119705761 n=1 Tax=Motacilla alba alba TaxID=1094192 RepID=UPI0018D52538|nr:uncharacterized protein LOC119705761 [Motacilla alba alba]
MSCEVPPIATLLSSFFNIIPADSFVCLFLKIYCTECCGEGGGSPCAEMKRSVSDHFATLTKYWSGTWEDFSQRDARRGAESGAQGNTHHLPTAYEYRWIYEILKTALFVASCATILFYFKIVTFVCERLLLASNTWAEKFGGRCVPRQERGARRVPAPAAPGTGHKQRRRGEQGPRDGPAAPHPQRDGASGSAAAAGAGPGSPRAGTCRVRGRPSGAAAPCRPPQPCVLPRSIIGHPPLPPPVRTAALGKSSPFSCHMDRLIGWERRRDKGLQQISA